MSNNARVYLWDFDFRPVRLCDDHTNVYAAQVKLDDGTVLVKASRVYNQWGWTTADGSYSLDKHPGTDKDKILAVNKEMIGILIGIAQAHNKEAGIV